MFSSNANCGNCHDAAVEGTAAIAGSHPNSNVDVYDVTSGDLGYPALNPIGNGFQSCTTAYCHSDGKGNYKPATWGGTTTGCNFCHDNPPATGAHDLHANAASVYGTAGVSSTAGEYNFDCGNCHPTDVASHGNGAVDVSLNPADGGALKSKNSPAASVTGSGTTAVCNLTYCHSDGSKTGAAIVAGASPQWGGSFAGDKCAGCHQNSPAGSQHGAHVVGIHYSDIYTGTTGLATAGSAINSSHGNGASSTTINCNVCHNDTVTVSYNALNTVCASCHTDTNTPATGNESAVIASKVSHVNGTPDVAFGTFSVNSKAQMRDNITTVTELTNSWTRTNGYKAAASTDASKRTPTYAAGSCSSVDCHNGNSVSWTQNNLSCRACHTALTQ
jgi:predicted CxxxxCH...CXXCH cytochrome family protein